jgi:hypothetical protein
MSAELFAGPQFLELQPQPQPQECYWPSQEYPQHEYPQHEIQTQQQMQYQPVHQVQMQRQPGLAAAALQGQNPLERLNTAISQYQYVPDDDAPPPKPTLIGESEVWTAPSESEE